MLLRCVVEPTKTNYSAGPAPGETDRQGEGERDGGGGVVESSAAFCWNVFWASNAAGQCLVHKLSASTSDNWLQDRQIRCMEQKTGTDSKLCGKQLAAPEFSPKEHRCQSFLNSRAML